MGAPLFVMSLISYPVGEGCVGGRLFAGFNPAFDSDAISGLPGYMSLRWYSGWVGGGLRSMNFRILT